VKSGGFVQSGGGVDVFHIGSYILRFVVLLIPLFARSFSPADIEGLFARWADD
jgi:hypothetical protein